MLKGRNPSAILLRSRGRGCIGRLMKLRVQFVSPLCCSSSCCYRQLIIIGDGKLESDVLPVAETVMMMEIMDRVREIGGLKYPESVEKV
jgi:hypothetical protein